MDKTPSKPLELNEGKSGPELLSQLKGFPLTQRLDGISILGSVSAFPRDRFCVHGQQNKGQPGPLIRHKGKGGKGFVSDTLLLLGDSCETGCSYILEVPVATWYPSVATFLHPVTEIGLVCLSSSSSLNNWGPLPVLVLAHYAPPSCSHTVNSGAAAFSHPHCPHPLS